MSGTLLEHVSRFLQQAGIPHALIGAAAMAVHGVSRSTLDQDLLTTDARVLVNGFWSSFSGADIDIRRGGADDPLAGLVRLRAHPDRDVDVVVGRHAWQQQAVERAERIAGVPVAVVRVPDLILLKLYAAGSQDLWDIEQLLAVGDAAAIRRHVDEGVDVLPAAAASVWSRWSKRE